MVLIKQLKGYQSYQSVIKNMEKNVEKIKSEGENNEVVWLLEHNSVFTAGSSNSVLNQEYIEKIPVINVNRGGQMTFHGPGQLVIYFMLNIKKRKLVARNSVYKIYFNDVVSKNGIIKNYLVLDCISKNKHGCGGVVVIPKIKKKYLILKYFNLSLIHI